MWWPEKCGFHDLSATKIITVGQILLLTYAQYFLNFHDQGSKYKDAGLLQ